MKTEMTFTVKDLRRIAIWGGIFQAMSSKWSGDDARIYARLGEVIRLLEREQRERREGKDAAHA